MDLKKDGIPNKDNILIGAPNKDPMITTSRRNLEWWLGRNNYPKIAENFKNQWAITIYPEL